MSIMVDVNSRLAARVRALRSESGMTLDALAGKSDVSRSMLSVVERGESSPTAVVLEKIAAGLGVSLASLFDAVSDVVNPVSSGAGRVTWRDPASGYVRRNISPPSFASPIRIVEVLMPAGAHVAYETGARDQRIDQQIWVQDGAIEVTIGRATHRLAADDCLAMQLDAPTSFRNRTRKAARYIVVIATSPLRVGRT